MIGLNKKTDCANVFIVLADLYKHPTRGIWDEIQQQDLLKKLEKSVSELFSIDFSIDEVLPENYEEFTEIYMTSIGSTQKKAALPIESLYKRWTLDETCTLPFARDKGYILGDSALHINYLLAELKIEIPNELQGMPDHLTILLELLAYFIEHAPESSTAEFLDDHFDWLDEFESQLTKVAVHPFYQRLTGALIEIIKAQRNSYQ